SQHWPCFFPQHGAGRKHLRPIVLEPWQKWVAVERHPRVLLRGLIHSDGSRFINRVKRPYGVYEYPRYMFSNRSADIRAIFALACQRVGVECKPTNEWLIAVSKREHVAFLDTIIGPKT
ncbi:MAG: transcriptional regulator, partial [Acidimicrobiia bacterium]